MKNKIKWFKLFGIAILIWLVLKTDIERVGNILSEAHLIFVIWALTLLVGHLIVKFFRYQYFLSKINIFLAFKKTAHYSLAANYLSFITPGRIGELFKAYFIHKSIGAPLNKLLACSIMDRLFDAYVLALTAIFGLVLSDLIYRQTSTILTVMLTLIIVFPFIFLPQRMKTLLSVFFQWLNLSRNKMITLPACFKDFFMEIVEFFDRRMIVGVLISIIAYLFFFGSCYLLALSIDITLSFFQISFFVAIATILSFMPISFAGIGTREASLVFLFSTENITPENALAFSSLVFLLTYLFFGIVGFFSFMTLDYNRKELMEKPIFEDFS